MLLPLENFINVKRDFINENVYIDFDHIDYRLKIPKLKDVETGEEFIQAVKYYRDKNDWHDEEFVKFYVKAVCLKKCLRPTLKDLEKIKRKWIKKNKN